MGNSFNPPRRAALPRGRHARETLALLKGCHRGGGNASLRVAVLSANDGLVSNLSLVIGGAGAVPSQETLLLAGLADHATAVQRPALETNGNTSIEAAIRTKIIPRGHRTYVLGVGSQRPKECSRVSMPGHGDEQKELTCAPIE
jgi:hypothetical protein